MTEPLAALSPASTGVRELQERFHGLHLKEIWRLSEVGYFPSSARVKVLLDWLGLMSSLDRVGVCDWGLKIEVGLEWGHFERDRKRHSLLCLVRRPERAASEAGWHACINFSNHPGTEYKRIHGRMEEPR